MKPSSTLLRELSVLVRDVADRMRFIHDENDLAWGIIANVSNGDWEKQSPEWQDAAHRWGVRNGYRMENPA